MTISGYCQLVNSADIYFRIIPAPLNHGGAVNAKSADADTTEFFFLPIVDFQRVQRQSGSAMQTCRFISSVNSTFMGSFLLSSDGDIEAEALCLFEVANLLLRQRTRPHAGELVQLLGGFAYRHSGQQVLVAIVKHSLSFLPVLPISQHF
mgnify:CR=1 FL=1